jgi:hypothetical protein
MSDERLSVDEALERIKERVGVADKCPFCGGSVWRKPPDVVQMLAVAPNFPESEELDKNTLLPVPSLLLVCEKCLFIRLHFVPPK